jgi:hypothetical protein
MRARRSGKLTKWEVKNVTFSARPVRNEAPFERPTQRRTQKVQKTRPREVSRASEDRCSVVKGGDGRKGSLSVFRTYQGRNEIIEQFRRRAGAYL